MSLILGIAFAASDRTAGVSVLTVLYATVLGVAIDLDHLLIARKNTGDWRVLRRCIVRPKAVLLDQDVLMQPSDVPPAERLFSHILITGVLVVSLLALNRNLAIVTFVVLSAHIVADIVADAFPKMPFSPGSNTS